MREAPTTANRGLRRYTLIRTAENKRKNDSCSTAAPPLGGGVSSGGSPCGDPLLRQVILDLRYRNFFAVENSRRQGLSVWLRKSRDIGKNKRDIHTCIDEDKKKVLWCNHCKTRLEEERITQG